MCPLLRKSCPQTREGKKGCEWWVVPGRPPTEAFRADKEKFPATGKCLEHLKLQMLWDLNCNMIGNQQAVESFRNGVHDSAPVVLEMLVNGLSTKALKITEGAGRAKGQRGALPISGRPE